jgi:superfamily II DNA or RNA helicase
MKSPFLSLIFHSFLVHHTYLTQPLSLSVPLVLFSTPFSISRQANLDKFREGEQQFLVCTDLAARGLDIPEIDHVIMFDFPLNPVDYIHR